MVIFRNFVDLKNNEKEMIFKWRNDERTNRFFINKNITKDEHYAFMKSLKYDKRKLYFLILLNAFEDENDDKIGSCEGFEALGLQKNSRNLKNLNGLNNDILQDLQGLLALNDGVKKAPIGVINFVDISKDECEFGIYQNPNLRGFGGFLLKCLTNYAFEILSVKRLNARAFNENEKAIKLFANFGFSVLERDIKFTYFQMDYKYFINKRGGVLVFICFLFVKHYFLDDLFNKILNDFQKPTKNSRNFVENSHCFAKNSRNFQILISNPRFFDLKSKINSRNFFFKSSPIFKINSRLKALNSRTLALRKAV